MLIEVDKKQKYYHLSGSYYLGTYERGWVLVEKVISGSNPNQKKGRKAQNPGEARYETICYPWTLDGVFNKMIDLEVNENFPDLEEVNKTIKKLKEDIFDFMEEFKINPIITWGVETNEF